MFFILLVFLSSLMWAQTTCPSSFQNKQFNLPPILNVEHSSYVQGILTLNMLIPSLYFATELSVQGTLKWSPPDPSNQFWSIANSPLECYNSFFLTTNYTNIASTFDLLSQGEDTFVTSKILIRTTASVEWDRGTSTMEFESQHPFKLKLPSYVQAHATAYVLGSAPDLPLDSVNVFTKIATVEASEITLQFDTITQWPFQFNQNSYEFRPEFGDVPDSRLSLVSACDTSQSFLPDGRSECLQSWELVFDASTQCQITDSFLLTMGTECIDSADCNEGLFTSHIIEFSLHTSDYCPLYLGNVTMQDCPRFTATTVGILDESNDFQPQFSSDGTTLTLNLLMSNDFWNPDYFDTSLVLGSWQFSNDDESSGEVTIFESDDCSTRLQISAPWAWWLENGEWTNDDSSQIVATSIKLEAISKEVVYSPDLLAPEDGFHQTMSSFITIEVSYEGTGTAVTDYVSDGTIIYAPPSVYSVAISKQLSDVTLPSPLEVSVMGATLTFGVVTTTQYPYFVTSLSDIQAPSSVTVSAATYELINSCDSYVITLEGVEVCVQEWRLTFDILGCDLAGNYTASLTTECNPDASEPCPSVERPLILSLPSENFCPHMANKQAQMPVTAFLDAFDSPTNSSSETSPRTSWFLDQTAYFRVTVSTSLAEFTGVTLLQIIVTQNDVDTMVYNNGETVPGYESLEISDGSTETPGSSGLNYLGLAYHYFDMKLGDSVFSAAQWTHSEFEITAIVEYTFENGARRRVLLTSDGTSSASKSMFLKPRTEEAIVAEETESKDTRYTFLFFIIPVAFLSCVYMTRRKFFSNSYEKVENTFLV